MEDKNKWISAAVMLVVLFIAYLFIKEIFDPTPCYPGEVIEYYEGRRSGICQTTYEEYDAWAQKHMSHDKYLKWRATVTLDEDLDDEDY